VVATDKACKDIDLLYCQAGVTDNEPIKGETRYKLKERALHLSDKLFTYQVAKRGKVPVAIESFAAKIAETLAASKGWGQVASFKRVQSGGDFTITLTQASLVPSFSSACSSMWSCRTGNNVVINATRWTEASPSWNAAGGSLRNYQHMVINHEVGHWLGHGHAGCSRKGALAPVMLQQSIDLQGCTFNPWPLQSELATIR